MAEKYEIQPTSLNSAVVKGLVLGSKQHTRTVLYAEEVNNASNPHASLKIKLVHQRKRAGEDWKDLPADSLSSASGRRCSSIHTRHIKDIGTVSPS